jgi:ribosomal protein S18 acetylase RimI-like enzyme
MPEYQGASFEGIKYSKLCFELVDQFLVYENIRDIILWTWKDNIKAIKRYQDLGFVSVDNPKVLKYYTKIAKRNGFSEEDLRVFWRHRDLLLYHN